MDEQIHHISPTNFLRLNSEHTDDPIIQNNIEQSPTETQYPAVEQNYGQNNSKQRERSRVCDKKASSIIPTYSKNIENLRKSTTGEEENVDSKAEEKEDLLWIPAPEDQVIVPVWAFGFNQTVPVINLSKTKLNVVLYSSSHLVIVYNIDANKQRILRGHVNEVTCLGCSDDKRWLVSGDSGPDNAVIIWDRKTGDPVRTMLNPHKNGVVSVALTGDARYLGTLSAEEVNQEFAIWNWTTGSEKPMCLVRLNPEYSGQRWINFKPNDYYHVATNSHRQVIFYHWETNGEIEAYAPPLTDEMFNKKVGTFSGTHFVPETNTALSATSQGLVVVWETDTVDEKKNDKESPFKKPVKLVSLHEKPITFLGITECRGSTYAIVTGDTAGSVKFFDTNFMLLYWYQNLNSGPIVTVSFASLGILCDSSAILQSTNYPQCSTIHAERFVVEDFIVTTAWAKMIKVTVNGDTIQIIHRDNHSEVNGLSTHPLMPHLVICSLTGLLKVYDYETRMVIAMKDYGSNEGIQTCRYGPLGKYLAVGFTSGYVRIVDAITLEDVTPEPFTYGRGAITHVDFSPRGDYCAYADSSHTTTLLRASSDDTEPPWHYVGRIRVHYRPITDLMFWIGRGCKNCRLFTISEDRTLAEYDISHASLHNFPLMARYRVEQLATPLCFSRLPPYYKEEFLFVATSTMKLKLLNSTSFMCRKVVMARPEAIQYHKVLPLPSKKSATAHFLVCISEERLAVVMLPLDGDPLKSTNVIAHPSGPRGTGRASSLAVSHCGRYAFTAGGPDDCVHMWAINPKTLEDRVKCAVDVKYRFYKLITPEFLHELKDYYYYSMLRTQGLRSLETRHTSMTIPITEIPFVMRAIGYYPTEEDIENMINEVKYSGFVETGTYVSDIDLDTFIQMYCNYKPFQGIFYKDVESAFHQLCVVRDLDTGKALKFRDPQAKITDPKSIPPEYLFSYLQTIGEPIGESELTEYLSTLLGYFPEGGRPENTVMVDEDEMNKAVDACLPVFLNAENFIYNILGMRPCSMENSEPNPLKCDKLRVCSADHERSESNVVSSTQTE